MLAILLRAHHALCLQFFEGKGYSEEFTRRTYEVIGRLREDPDIKISAGADVLCQCCPMLENGTCVNCDETELLDKAVMEICGFAPGEVMPASGFFGRAREKIISPSRLRDVCGECRWGEICFRVDSGEMQNRH